MPAGEAAAGDDAAESALLAVPPGSRDVRTYKGGAKYRPVKTDKRPAGARSRSMAAAGSREKSSSTRRNTHPGMTDINTLTGMNGLAGIYEQDESIYKLREKTEEDKLFEMNNSIRSLLEGLEEKELLTEQQNEDKT
jgi:hypothetical protein